MMDGPNEPVTNPFLRPSKLFGADSSSPQRGLLRPSVLTATAEKLRTDKPASLDVPVNPFGSSSSRTAPSLVPQGSLASNPFFKVKGPLAEEQEENECSSRSTLAAAAAAKMKEVTSFGSPSTKEASLFGAASAAKDTASFGAASAKECASFGAASAKEGASFGVASANETPLFGAMNTKEASSFSSPCPKDASATKEAVSFGAANAKEPSSFGAANASDSGSFGAANGAPTLAPKPSGPVGFIFGKNISERVVKEQSEEGVPPAPAAPEHVPEPALPESGEEEEDGATFGAIAAARSDDEEAAQGGPDLEASKRSLSASAEEYQARQARPEFDEVEVLTGEEGESNVLHLICRAFLYDRANNKWTERGRGFMRLNDAVQAPHDSEGASRLRSRLIFRLQGSLKVVLNTPVWAGMRVEQADEKRIRLTAQVPEEGVRILLFQLNSSNEAHHLHSALSSRILQLRQAEDPAAGEDGAVGQARKRRHSGASSDGGERGDGDEDEDDEKAKRAKLPGSPEPQ